MKKFGQILSLSFQSIRGNKLRTSLTVLGVVVGIFSIIVIMTILGMLQGSIESGFSQLNKNTFQIEKFNRMEGRGGDRDRNLRNRKDITIEDAQQLKELLTQAKYVGAEQWQFGKIVKFQNLETNPNINIAGVTLDAMKTNNWNVDYGRDFMTSDVQYSNDVCVLGKDIVEKIFPNLNPIGYTVRVDGYPLQVIGVLEEQPSLFGNTRDNYVMVPITTFQSIYGRRSFSVNITVMSHSKEDYDEVIDAAIGYMRTLRKVQPGEENDFSIFSNETLISQVNDITSGVKIGAMVVSIIALLAAGVGIMNIMLVSVTERTKEIGIRKAIGARKMNILLQFLSEAVILCLFGGFIGIILGVGIGNLAGSFLNAQNAIPVDWVIIGLSLCVFVGVIFGTYPAYKAANLDPIEALRYE
ncbi:MAG: peptide ABC transporter permease [Ignavibacteria bacterium CG2_30_36_16]|nr:FtsX-like permease family protein [Ignavibacteria bacterium]OIP55810.1 MAG: peptide ABC transporter permease [Ignavibacteria bacterium CG2_30_36_16]PJA98923.1 MAG: peptide ABC transporter permease [Ignavibacteria bacterium CG_4_9_14_3_um_filter_36_18]